MSSTLSNWAKEFILGDHVAVIGTLNRDGSSHLTTIWYLVEANGAVVMSTIGGTQKVKNLQRDPRIALCVGDESRSVSLYGRATISADQALIRKTIERLVERYVKAAGARAKVVAALVQQPRVVLSFTPEKATEFSVEGPQ